MAVINENPKWTWALIAGACAFCGVIWFIAWFRSPWPIVGYIGSAVVYSIPVILGIIAGVRKRKEN